MKNNLGFWINLSRIRKMLIFLGIAVAKPKKICYNAHVVFK